MSPITKLPANGALVAKDVNPKVARMPENLLTVAPNSAKSKLTALVYAKYISKKKIIPIIRAKLEIFLTKYPMK